MRFAQAFRTPDLRKKLIFTSCIIVVFRFGSALPAPGISAPNVRYCSGRETSRGAAMNLYAVLNIFSGNSLLHVTVFALGIMPYITASISGVSLLIMVGVGLDTVKQVESQLQQHHYEGFLRRPVRAAGKFAGTPQAPAALNVS